MSPRTIGTPSNVNAEVLRIRSTYIIGKASGDVAWISRRWFRIRDTDGIEVAPGEDDALIPAATICIDEMARA